MTPTIRLIAWESRNPAMVFVAVPDQRGRYVLTDRSVAMVTCSYCKAAVGEPCKSRQGYNGGTHSARRITARNIWPRPNKPDILHTQSEEPLEFPPLPEE